jgi:hypothetical protein
VCRTAAVDRARDPEARSWKPPDLRNRYRGYFSWYLEQQMRSG